MSAEVAGRIAAKHNPELEAEAVQWLETLTGTSKEGELSDWLHDGQVPPLIRHLLTGSDRSSLSTWYLSCKILCKAMNALQPGSIKKVNENKMAFKQMENISNFLAACQKYV